MSKRSRLLEEKYAKERANQDADAARAAVEELESTWQARKGLLQRLYIPRPSKPSFLGWGCLFEILYWTAVFVLWLYTPSILAPAAGIGLRLYMLHRSGKLLGTLPQDVRDKIGGDEDENEESAGKGSGFFTFVVKLGVSLAVIITTVAITISAPGLAALFGLVLTGISFIWLRKPSRPWQDSKGLWHIHPAFLYSLLTGQIGYMFQRFSYGPKGTRISRWRILSFGRGESNVGGSTTDIDVDVTILSWLLGAAIVTIGSSGGDPDEAFIPRWADIDTILNHIMENIKDEGDGEDDE
ncbi:hypothetical protein JXA34_03700 [Patescibacteria group bacterium]|nr:hypothetical protein [Patescibacteria group bacterium]